MKPTPQSRAHALSCVAFASGQLEQDCDLGKRKGELRALRHNIEVSRAIILRSFDPAAADEPDHARAASARLRDAYKLATSSGRNSLAARLDEAIYHLTRTDS